MEQLDLSWIVTINDFREAQCYGLFMRKRPVFRAAALILVSFFVYLVFCISKVLSFQPVILVPAVLALLWGVLNLAGAERQILAYTKSKDSLLGLRYRATFTRTSFTLEIPEKKGFRAAGKITDLYSVYELYHIFLLYTDPSQVFIIPTGNLSREENFFLRKVFRDNLGKRFAGVFRR